MEKESLSLNLLSIGLIRNLQQIEVVILKYNFCKSSSSLGSLLKYFLVYRERRGIELDGIDFIWWGSKVKELFTLMILIEFNKVYLIKLSDLNKGNLTRYKTLSFLN